MKRAPSPLPELLLLAGVVVAGAVLAGWAWVSFDVGRLPGEVRVLVEPSQVAPPAGERAYLSRTLPEPWPADEPGPWLVLRTRVELPPVDLEPPYPTVPAPPSPPPIPGPRLEYSGSLPRWGTYPRKGTPDEE